MADTELWKLKFGVEVSTRYHEWRRAAMETLVRIDRVATLTGAVVTLLTALAASKVEQVAWVIATIAVIIAITNLSELVFDIGARARAHTELYRRFAELQ